MADDNVIRPSRFERIKGAVRKACGIDPVIYIEPLTLMKGFMESDLSRTLFKMHSDCGSVAWEWDIAEGEVKGVTLRLVRKDKLDGR